MAIRWMMVKSLLMVSNVCSVLCTFSSTHSYDSNVFTYWIYKYIMYMILIDDPESRMLYEHHGENEMMTSFMNVRPMMSTIINCKLGYSIAPNIAIYFSLTKLWHFMTLTFLCNRTKNQNLMMKIVAYIILKQTCQWLLQKMKACN